MIYHISLFFCCILLLGLLCIPGYYIRKKGFSNPNLLSLLYVFGLIFIFRLIVNLFMVNPALTFFENFADSIVHTLQTFSMDEDYTQYLSAGKQFITDRLGTFPAALYGFVISVLNVAAPILGGAVLLDILTGIFPGLKLRLFPGKDKFVFSELNEFSITLAEDISEKSNQSTILPPWKERFPFLLKVKEFFNLDKPRILFTDAYADSESETQSELFERAKSIGAICLKADVSHLNFAKSRTVHYFLIDRQENANLAQLSGLLDSSVSNRL